ncbi:MAG: helix-turn-helix domain-containing protein [Eubacteriales bacterium]|nr:helix-turn-helix domain-containing protein [Eubacteriales bacterium]
MIRKDFIISELKYRYPEIRESIRNPREAVGRPLFFENGERQFGSHIVICFANELNSIHADAQSEALFLCIGDPEQSIIDSLDLCIFPGDTESRGLFNFIQRLFDRLDEWRQRMKTISESEDDITVLLNCAADMVQNPLWLCDEKLHMIARSGRTIELQNDSEVFESYKMCESFLNVLKVHGGNSLHFSEAGLSECFVLPVQSVSTIFYIICIASERPFYGSDDVVLENLGGFAKLMISEHRFSTRAPRFDSRLDEIEKCLCNLLDHTEQQEGAALHALDDLGWNEQKKYYFVAAEPISGKTKQSSLNTLCDQIENMIPECCVFYRPPYLVMVAQNSEKFNDQSIDVLNEFGEREGVHFGAGPALAGFNNLDLRLAIAIETLNRSNEKAAATFSDVAEEYFCDLAVSKYPIDFICLPSVGDMAEYDKKHGTKYLETVECYFQNRFNAVKTASDLFIHRSTFLYRLEKIKEQFGLDLEAEMKTPIHMLLSLRLVEKQKTSTL